MRADFKEFTTLSDQLVRDFTGLVTPDTAPAPIVVDRAGWIKANIESFSGVIAPLTQKLERKVGPTAVTRRMLGAALGVQLGGLLGYLSQRVLGQYDLVLGAESGGKVYFVGPNVVEMERRFNLDARDFRLWIAIHEITHRTQFTAVPWLRAQMHTFLEGALAGLELDAKRVREVIERGRQIVLAGPSAWSAQNLMGVVMTAEQLAIMDEMQAMMCVIEGHGTYVMNRIGAERIPTFATMRDAIESRRGRGGGPERAVQRLLGMEMKYEQYALGERFCNEVAAKAGDNALNQVWADRASFPTMDELRAPADWLRRVAG